MSSARQNPTEMIEIARLEFDRLNPRLPSNLTESSQEVILQWMVNDGGIADLMSSIGEQGYFNGEPLLVVPNDAYNFTVVEGNRRLAALKLLQNPEQLEERRNSLVSIAKEAIHKPVDVSCMVYNTRNEILNYLGYRHVTGIKSWGPLAKARYLQLLSENYSNRDDKATYQMLAKSIGSRADYVKRSLAGLKLYDEIEERDYYGIQGLNESVLSFSLITTALANSNIVHFLGLEDSGDIQQENLDRGHLEELTRWIFERKDGRTPLGESRHFRDLNKVVASEVALREFRQGRTLDDALVFTDAPVESFRTLLRTAINTLEGAQRQLRLIRNGLKESDKETLTDLRLLISDILSALRGRLED